jgi:hypothetical protein
MNLVLRTADRALLSMTAEELGTLSNALNEVCNGVHIDDRDFQTRVGVDRDVALEMLRRIGLAIDAPVSSGEISQTWADNGAVMVKAITAFGDPVELSESESRKFAESLATAMREAS